MDKTINIELDTSPMDIDISIEHSVNGDNVKNYNALDNKPSINGVVLENNKTSEDLGLLDKNTKIPKKVSELDNDLGYLEREIDPTVPSWAKMPTKPTYIPSEIGIIVNPEGEPTAKLEKIQIGDVIFSVEGGQSYINVSESEEQF